MMFQYSSMGTSTQYNRAKCTRIINECQTINDERDKTKWIRSLHMSWLIIQLSLLTNRHVSGKVFLRMCTSTYFLLTIFSKQSKENVCKRRIA